MELSPSYLDDPQTFVPGTPRWAKHFYALSLRGLGDGVNTADGEFLRFATEYGEREEFNELTGVKSVLISPSLPVQAKIDSFWYGVYIDSREGPKVVFGEFDTPEEAHDTIKSFQAASTRAFNGKEPWVASMLDPGTKLELVMAQSPSQDRALIETRGPDGPKL